MPLANLIDQPEMDPYRVSWKPGETVFMENENSHDLYILISGTLDVLKGSKNISQITGKGTLFGEMSYLLDARRTATVKARTESAALRIPQAEIKAFLGKFPEVAQEISKLLAGRLEQSTQIIYGLREMSDQLPDALTLTDRDGKVLMLNTAAEKLYGREWSELRNQSIETIYENPEEYRQFLEEVLSRRSVNEQTLKIKHPETGTRYISTSTTVLYDAHHNFQGVLSLGRDITSVIQLERRYRKLRTWLLPAFLLLGLLIAAIFYGYPYFTTGHRVVDARKQALRNQLAADYRDLTSEILAPFQAGNRPAIERQLEAFLKRGDEGRLPYFGLLVLDENKQVFAAAAVEGYADAQEMIGSSYTGVDFEGPQSSLHRVLTLYRVDKDHPTGRKGIEIAIELRHDATLLGWLVFQMKTQLLAERYHLNEDDLRDFRFKRS